MSLSFGKQKNHELFKSVITRRTSFRKGRLNVARHPGTVPQYLDTIQDAGHACMNLATKISVQPHQNPTGMSKFHTLGPEAGNHWLDQEHINTFTFLYEYINIYNAESYKNVAGVQIEFSHTYSTKCQTKMPTASTGKRRRSCCCCCCKKPPGAWRWGARLDRLLER